jgi:hypothetical protein
MNGRFSASCLRRCFRRGCGEADQKTWTRAQSLNLTDGSHLVRCVPGFVDRNLQTLVFPSSGRVRLPAHTPFSTKAEMKQEIQSQKLWDRRELNDEKRL